MLAVFRTEIGAAVRHASPLLFALIDQTDFSMDEIASGLRPARGWPDRPRLPAYCHLSDMSSCDRRILLSTETAGVEVVHSDGERFFVHVVDHSLEVAGRLGRTRFTSLFGLLSIEVPDEMSPQPRDQMAGRRLEDAFFVPLNLRRGWIIERVGAAPGPGKVEIVVRTGIRKYKMPWAR